MMRFGAIWGTLMIGAIVWIVFRFANKKSYGDSSLSNPLESPPDKENAMEILKKRYARGEIGQEEYRLMEEDLKQS